MFLNVSKTNVTERRERSRIVMGPRMQLLRDESVAPTGEVIASLLGDMCAVYTEFISPITAEPMNLDPEWKYYRDVRAWLCKIVHKKKTVSWISLWGGAFKVTTYFSEKHSKEAYKIPVDNKLLESFHKTALTRKNPYFSLDISSRDQLPDLLKIMEHKKRTLK